MPPLTPQQSKDIEAAANLIIRNCRARYEHPLAKAMAYAQVEGFCMAMRKVVHIDGGEGGLDKRSYELEDALKKKINMEI